MPNRDAIVEKNNCLNCLYGRDEENLKMTRKKYDVCNADMNDIMTGFCVNKFPPMTASSNRPSYHKSAKAHSPNNMDTSITKLTVKEAVKEI